MSNIYVFLEVKVKMILKIHRSNRIHDNLEKHELLTLIDEIECSD